MTANNGRRPRRWVQLPMETKAREFHAMLLLACHFVEAGYGVLFGHKHILKKEKLQKILPPGVYFDNGVVARKARMFQAHHRNGNRIAAWCEEGLLFPDEEDYLSRKISPETLREVDIFFAWGDHQRELILRKYPEFAATTRAAGNPRFDLLRPEFREFFAPAVGRLRERLGRIILVNTNFSFCNHHLGPGAFMETLRRNKRIRPPFTEEFYRKWADFKQRIFDAFTAMLPGLSAAFPDHTIVVRPHPSENHDVWREKTAALGNVVVEFEGNVVEWLMACDVILHNGCTTGIEAYALERPVIAYRPVKSEVYDAFLANSLSFQVESEEDLISRTRSAVAGELVGNPSDADEKEAVAKHYFCGRTGPLACERIVDGIRTLDLPEAPLRGGVIRERYLDLKFGLRRRKPPESYVLQKFPGLSLEEMEDCIGRLSKVSGRFGGVGVERDRSGAFVLTAR